jgi:aminoglycoside/choline kinase family phosphotransferase
MALRKELAEEFLAKSGWEGSQISILAADASFRSYYRVKNSEGEISVLMDAPPPKEDVKPFIMVDEKLVELGFSAPKIIAKDEEKGFLLLEDLGDATYTTCLKRGDDETGLYELATDVLVELNSINEQSVIPENLPEYDDDKLLEEACLLTNWYMPAVDGLKKPNTDEYANLWKNIFPLVRKVPDTMVLRDYHIDNLIKLEQRDGTKACGLLDFQDAVKGAVTYDIMSLLEDARRDIDEKLIKDMKDRYFKSFIKKVGEVCSREEFDTSWAILAAQRHAKVIGIFTRLCVRDGKSQYLHHIPRVWRLFENAIENPALSDIKEWVDINIPKEKRVVPNAI